MPHRASPAETEVQKMVKFARGTAKNAKSAKNCLMRNESELFDKSENSSGLGFMPLAFLAVQYQFPRRYEVDGRVAAWDGSPEGICHG
jgi:hypothetical protein